MNGIYVYVAMNVIISAILDEIKDEIEKFVGVSISDVEVMPKSDVLQIIDKYKTGGEDVE